jgi:LPS export ABC transporter protein LptC
MHLTKRQSIFLAVTFLALFFVSGIALLNMDRSKSQGDQSASVQQPEQPAQEAKSGEADPNKSRFELKEFHRTETRNGQKVWEVKAKHGEYFPETNSAQVTEATLWLFKEDGTTFRLNARTAKLYLKGAALSKAEASEGVTLNYNDKLNVETDFAIYDKDKKSVFAPGGVKFVSDRIEVNGEELNVDLETEQFVLARNVSSLIKPENENVEEQHH